MARADDDDDYDDDVDDDDRGRGATYADAGARDDDDDDDYDGASEDAMDASDDGDAYEDESESESEDDDYDEDVGKTKKRGKTGRTTRASGGAVVVVVSASVLTSGSLPRCSHLPSHTLGRLGLIGCVPSCGMPCTASHWDSCSTSDRLLLLSPIRRSANSEMVAGSTPSYFLLRLP